MLEGMIGPYRVGQEIGRGGMGVVYLAHDTRLDRAVAIKALPDELAGDPGRLERFEREARTLAQLHHPAVAGIYGVEERDGHKFLVLEYVEGETLAERLDRGPLPVDEALEVAGGIASGVEAAHDAGVIHRDLKPANVKLTPEGRIKVLDFGLARTEDTGSSGSFSENPTLTTPAPHSPSVPGAILGTAAYMSPEQARGRRVDKRTDIWSFGAVLYEMLTGAGPFAGETASDSIGAILHKDVDLDRLPAATPPAVRQVLERCLERDRSMRYRDIGDARIDLERAQRQPAPGAPERRRRGTPAPLILALVAVAAAIAGAAAWTLKPAPPAPAPEVARLSLTLPWARERVVWFDVSPDGRMIAAIVREQDRPEQTWSVYLRRLDRAGFERLHTLRRSPNMLVFTPDGRDLIVGEYTESNRDILSRLPVEGGRPVPLVDAETGRFGIPARPVWVSADEFLVTGETELWRVFAISVRDGGTRPVVEVAQGEFDLYRFTSGVAGGRFALIDTFELSEGAATLTIRALDLETGQTRVVAERAQEGVFVAPDAIVLRRSDAWFAAAFDPATCEIVGELVPLADEMAAWRVADGAGHLVGLGSGSSRGTLSMITREGAVSVVSPARRDYTPMALMTSPDGAWATAQYRESPDEVRETLACVDLATGSQRIIRTGLQFPVRWLDDGRLLYLRVPEDAEFEQRDLGVEVLAWDPESSASTPVARVTLPNNGGLDATPDGSVMVMGRLGGGAAGDEASTIRVIDLTDARAEPRVVHSTRSWIGKIALSPDARWLAFASGATGRAEVYVMRFAGERPGRPVRVSRDGGNFPVWAHGSSELLFMAPASDGVGATLVGATITGEDRPVVSPPTPVLGLDAIDGDHIAPTADGSAFVFVDTPERDPEDEHLLVVLGWADELRRRIARR
jgi:predicted Ser/Thr protein kinase